MAFRTGTGAQVSFDKGFEQIENIALAVKRMSETLRTQSAEGNLTGSAVVRYFDDVGNQRLALEDWVAKFTDTAAAAAYAQDRYNDPTYDVVAEYTAFRNAINDVLNYIEANIPTSLLTWNATAGIVTWNSYSVGGTSGLRAALDALIATVD